MKIDVNTPAAEIRKDIGIRRITFWFSLTFGILCLFAVPPAGVVLLLVSWASSSARKNDLKLLAQREQLDAAAADAATLEASAAAAGKAEAERLIAFLSAHDLVKTIHTKVVGVTFQNDDGSNRQDILADCIPGDQLELRPFVYKGLPAYAVFDGDKQIGNIPSETAQVIHDCSIGLVVRSEIAEITGGDGLKYGCNIIVQIYSCK